MVDVAEGRDDATEPAAGTLAADVRDIRRRVRDMHTGDWKKGSLGFLDEKLAGIRSKLGA